MKRNLGTELLTLYLLLVVPFLLVILIFDQWTGQRARAEAESTGLSLARAIAQQTDQTLRNALETVRQMALYPEVLAGAPAAMQSIFRVVQTTRPDLNLVYRLDGRGTMLYHYPTGPVSTVGANFGFRDYFLRALTTDQPVLSNGRISPTTGEAVASAVMPLWQGQRFVGVVATNIRLESLSSSLREIAQEYSAQDGMQITIIDPNGRILAHPNTDLLLEKASDIMGNIAEIALANQSGTIIQNAPDQIETLYAYAPIPTLHGSVIISRPTSSVLATQMTIRRFSEIAFIVFTGIGLMFWAVLMQRVILPIERLVPISKSIGEHQEIKASQRQALEETSKRQDQIGQLVKSIFVMEQSIRARIDEKNTLLETSQAVTSSLDTPIVLNRILEQVERLMGIQMSTIIALDEKTDLYRVQASRGLAEQYTQGILIQPDEPLSITVRALQTGRPAQVSDTEVDETYIQQKELARTAGYRSLLAMPLVTQHAPPSALIVYRPEVHTFSESEIELLSSFANHATMALENAALYQRSDQRLQEQTRRLEALIQSLDDGLILGDLNGNIIYTNRRISQMAGISQHDLTHTTTERLLVRILTRGDAPSNLREMVQHNIQHRTTTSIEIPIKLENRAMTMRLQFFSVTDTRGISIGQCILLHDITTDRELDRMRSSLVSTVSHELRTPLASIKGYATTLLAEDVEWDAKAQREFLQIISDEADRLTAMVNDLLDLSRVEAGNLVLHKMECDPAAIIRQAAARAHLAPGNRFEVEITPLMPRLYADATRVETILRNLIENAVKYAGETAHILVTVTRQGGELVFRVQDDGPGIPAEQSERVFDRFFRIDASLTRNTPGAGLGLAICEGFVRAHGGQIWLENVEKGACFAFSLPLETPSKGESI